METDKTADELKSQVAGTVRERERYVPYLFYSLVDNPTVCPVDTPGQDLLDPISPTF